MSPEELFQQAGYVIDGCNPSGVTGDSAAAFIQEVRARLRGIGQWLPPVYGTIGYADPRLMDLIRQLRFQSERVLINFPLGIESMSVSLEAFREYLKNTYPVSSPYFTGPPELR